MEILSGFLSANDANLVDLDLYYTCIIFFGTAYKAELKFSKILELRGNFRYINHFERFLFRIRRCRLLKDKNLGETGNN